MQSRFYTKVEKRGVDVCTMIETGQWDMKFFGDEATRLKLEPVLMWQADLDNDGKDAVRVHNMAVNTIKARVQLKRVYEIMEEIIRQIKIIHKNASNDSPQTLRKKIDNILND